MTRRSRTTVRYAFDAENRLLISKPEPSGRFRLINVVSGSIAVDPDNRLVYQAVVPVTSPAPTSPHRIVLDGNWRLSPDHELLFVLREGASGGQQTLHLRGELAGASANGMIFTLRQEGSEGARGFRQVTLSGRWEADARNRLAFLVQGADGSGDRLTLQGAWEIGAQHELVYQYRRRSAASSGAIRTIRFGGWWEVPGRQRLAYRMDVDERAGFEFRVALQSPTLFAASGQLVYQAGIQLAGRRTIIRRIALFGTWKLGRALAVEFEIPYADGRRTMRFSGTATIGEKNRLSVDLVSPRHEPLGLTVVFTRALSKDIELFLRVESEGRDREALAGVRVRF